MKEVLIAVVVTLALWYIPFCLYLWCGMFKWWFHSVLKWHRPDMSKQWREGFFKHSICKVCGQEITRDNQGNWLTDDEW